MTRSDSLNPLAQQVWASLSAEFPEWVGYFGTCGEGDLEVAVPAPPGSSAGHLVIFTSEGKDRWIRFSPPRMCYPVDDEQEMLSVIRQLLAESALFVVTMQGDDWVETTLIRPGDEPPIAPHQVAQIVSWSGKHDRTIGAKAPKFPKS